MKNEKIKSIVESVLLAKGNSVSLEQLAKIIGVKKVKIVTAIKDLIKDYYNQKSGLAIVRDSGKVQLVTVAKNAEYVEQIFKNDLQKKLTRAALEVLAIVAYRGPISNIEIEAIRGVNSAFTLRNLLMRGLITKIADFKRQKGYLYKITIEFIKKLGLENIKDLPDYKKLSKDERIESIIKIHSKS